MAVNGQLSSDNTSAVVQTTNGTTSTVIYTTPAFLADDGGQVVTFDIVGFDFDNAEIATAKIVVKLKNVAGTPTMIGTPIHLVPFSVASSTALVNCSANVTISGTNLVVRVIGVAGRTIDWTCNRFPSLSVLDNWTAVDAPQDGYVNWWKAARSRWEPVSPLTALFGTDVAGGDLTGNYPNPTVAAISASDFYVGNNLSSGTYIRALTGATGSFYGPLYFIAQHSSDPTYAGGSMVFVGGQGSLTSPFSQGGNITIDPGSSINNSMNGKVAIGGSTPPKWVEMTSLDGYKFYLGTTDEITSSQNAVIKYPNITLDARYTGGNIRLTTDGVTDSHISLTANDATGLITLQGGNMFLYVNGGSGVEMNFHSDTARYLNLSGLASGSSTINQLGTTVGAAGGASALPATPLGYLRIQLNGNVVSIPYYNAS